MASSTEEKWTIHVQTQESEPPVAISIPAGISVSDFLAKCGRGVERLAVLANPILPVFFLADGHKRRRLDDLDPEAQVFVCENFVAKSLHDNLNNQLDTVTKDAQSTCREKEAKINQLMLERVQVFKDACAIYQRGIVELQLQTFIGIHNDNPNDPKELQCLGLCDKKDFTTAMKHWRHCQKLKGVNIMTHYAQGVLSFAADTQHVEACLDNLYDALSSSMHCSVGTDFPKIKYAIPFVVSAEGQVEAPPVPTSPRRVPPLEVEDAHVLLKEREDVARKFKEYTRCECLYEGQWYEGVVIDAYSDRNGTRYKFRYDVDGFTSTGVTDVRLRYLPGTEPKDK